MLTTMLGAGVCAGILAIPPLRRSMLTRHIQTLFNRALPRMSATEAAALEAGTTGPEAAFFSGQFSPREIESRQISQLTAEECLFISTKLDPLLKQIDDQTIMQEGDLPAHVWSYLKEHRFFGLCIPKAMGGLGFSHRAHSDIVMRIAAVSPNLAVTVMVPNSLGPAELLQHYGTPEQIAYWLPRLAQGLEVPCFALTSPWAGSDAAAIPDLGTVVALDASKEGQAGLSVDELGLKLNWNKRYITLAPVATVMGLAFQTQDPHNYLGKGRDLGISVALIPTSHPGVKAGKRHHPMNAAFMNGPTEGRDVVIPLSWVIGGAQQLGAGWRMLMECLATGRAISLPALGASMARQTAVTVCRYARVREQFKLPLGKFHAVAEPLGKLAINAHLAECLRTFAVDALDAGERSSVLSAIAKYHLTELGRESLILGMDVLGGKAICQGPSNLLATSWQMAPIAITVEGANILTRALIIFGQGAVRSHPHVLAEMNSAKDRSAEGLQKFDAAFWSHMRKVLKDVLRAPLSQVTGTWQQGTPRDLKFLENEVRQAQRIAVNYSFIVEMLMLRLGGDLKRLELLSARLADILSGLVFAAAVYRDAAHRDFAYGKLSGAQRALVVASMRHALHRAEVAMINLLDNVPGRAFGWMLRSVTLPCGARVRAVSDQLLLSIAATALNEPKFLEIFEQGLLPGREVADSVHQDLFRAHLLASELTKAGVTGAQMRDTAWVAAQPAELQDAMREYRIHVDRLIQVDSFGEWTHH